MDELGDPEDVKLLVRALRMLRSWDQVEFAKAAGVDASSISHYETGRTVPSQRTLERLAGAVGLPLSFVKLSLLPALRASRTISALPLPGEGGENQERAGAELGRALEGAGRSLLATFFSQLGSVNRRGQS